MSNSYATKPDRGGCLSLWLGASVLFGILALFLLLGLGGEVSRRGYGLLFILSIVVVLFDLVCIYGIYEWKRWGVYGLVAASFLNLVLAVITGTGTGTTCISPFVQLGILWYLVHDKWDVFE